MLIIYNNSTQALKSGISLKKTQIKISLITLLWIYGKQSLLFLI